MPSEASSDSVSSDKIPGSFGAEVSIELVEETAKELMYRAAIGIPDDFVLSRIYPNPFNPSTSIIFGVPEVAKVMITIYNIRGQKVEVLSSQVYTPGYHRVRWDASTNASGIYFVTMKSDQFFKSQKIALVK